MRPPLIQPVRERLKLPLFMFFGGLAAAAADRLYPGILPSSRLPDSRPPGWATLVVGLAVMSYLFGWELPRAVLPGNWLNRAGRWVVRQVYGAGSTGRTEEPG